MRFLFLVVAVGCSNMEYQVEPHALGEQELMAHDPDVGPCAIEEANGLMYCPVPMPAEEAVLSCLLLDAVIAPAPETLEFQTVMAYGGLLHFGSETDWWISSEEYDEKYGCTVQSKYGSWTRGIDCDAPLPFVCRVTAR